MWPAIALVAEWNTRCTPNSCGFWTAGDAIVESTTVNGPARAPSASRSTMPIAGFAGVSHHTSCVGFSATAARRASASKASTSATSMPKRSHVRVSSWLVTENIDAWATMRSPGEHRANTMVDAAPIPDPKAMPASAPSTSATASAKACTVGVPLRA